MKDPLSEAFPAEFPIKVMGRAGSDLAVTARAIVENHMGPLAESAIRTRTSSDGNFVSLTYTVLAASRTQLDALYRELSACKLVLMAL